MDHRLARLDWDSLKAVVAVGRLQSFRRAAEELGTSYQTVSRTIARLEDVLGFLIFHREPEGARLTNEGRRIWESILGAEQSVTDVLRVAELSGKESGQIHLAVTEGIGAFWLTPKIASYVLETPDVFVKMDAAMKSVDVMRFEADIAIQLQAPARPDLVVKVLGYLHLCFFASKDYIARHGTMDRFTDLARHYVVEQQTDQLGGYGLDELFGAGATQRMVKIRTNFSSAHYWAVTKGAGIGLLPSYARMIGGDVEYLPVPDWRMKVPIYMTAHRDITQSSRHRAFMDALTEWFSPNIYPWFREEFVSPDALERTRINVDMREYFQGFVARQGGRLPIRKV